MTTGSLIECPMCKRQAEVGYYQCWHQTTRCTGCGFNDTHPMLGSPPSHPSPDTDGLVETMRRCARRADSIYRQTLALELAEVIEIVRQHYAGEAPNSNEGRPASGLKSPVEVAPAPVCSEMLVVGDAERLIRHAVDLGNKEYWRPSNEHDAALREWKLGGFKGERPSMQNHHGKSIIDCISDSVNQNLLPYLRTTEPVSVDDCIERIAEVPPVGLMSTGDWVRIVLDAAGVKYVE